MGRKGMRHAGSLPGSAKRNAIWKAMRLMTTFTVPELEALAEAKTKTVREVIAPLVHAGYIECVRPARSVRGDSYPKTWRLMRNTGPAAPRITADGVVVDTNLTPVTGSALGKRMAKHAPILVQRLRLLLEALEDQPLKAGVQKIAIDAACSLRAFDEAA